MSAVLVLENVPPRLNFNSLCRCAVLVFFWVSGGVSHQLLAAVGLIFVLPVGFSSSRGSDVSKSPSHSLNFLFPRAVIGDVRLSCGHKRDYTRFQVKGLTGGSLAAPVVQFAL